VWTKDPRSDQRSASRCKRSAMHVCRSLTRGDSHGRFLEVSFRSRLTIDMPSSADYAQLESVQATAAGTVPVTSPARLSGLAHQGDGVVTPLWRACHRPADILDGKRTDFPSVVLHEGAEHTSAATFQGWTDSIRRPAFAASQLR